MFRHTTENKGDHIVVRFYKRGERKIYHKFNVNYVGDWNCVEYEIENMEKLLKKSIKK